MNPEAQKRLDQCPDMSEGILRDAYNGVSSPRRAIKAFCLQCVGYVRADVKDCSARGCPLWLYRPYQAADEA